MGAAWGPPIAQYSGCIQGIRLLISDLLVQVLYYCVGMPFPTFDQLLIALPSKIYPLPGYFDPLVKL
jgi:hypothetical protein